MAKTLEGKIRRTIRQLEKARQVVPQNDSQISYFESNLKQLKERQITAQRNIVPKGRQFHNGKRVLATGELPKSVKLPGLLDKPWKVKTRKSRGSIWAASGGIPNLGKKR